MARRKQKPKKFARRMQKKLLFVFSFITLCLIGLIGRLMYLEYARGDKYEKIVLSQQEYDSRTIPFQRGDIVDTKGTVLSQTRRKVGRNHENYRSWQTDECLR